MKERRFWVFVAVALLFSTVVYSQPEGEKLFNQVCVACHTIGKGKLIGPDLANVHKRRPEEWLLRFIKSSQSVIKSGDAYAASLFEEYNRMVMPDNPYSDDQIRAIISYIAQNSPGGPGAAAGSVVSIAPGRPVAEATLEDMLQGAGLFQGTVPLENRGPSCNSCHNVNHKLVMAGGSLAKDLSEAFSRLGEAGIKAILSSPPFPAMKQAYQNHKLTEDEVFDLTAFLKKVDQEYDSQPIVNYRNKLLLSGFGGMVFLMIAFGAFWLRTKHSSVNRRIYERQIKSR
jgi:mono/diheme cytochrome c family protein